MSKIEGQIYVAQSIDHTCFPNGQVAFVQVKRSPPWCNVITTPDLSYWSSKPPGVTCHNFRMVLGRPATDDEVERLTAFLALMGGWDIEKPPLLWEYAP